MVLGFFGNSGYQARRGVQGNGIRVRYWLVIWMVVLLYFVVRSVRMHFRPSRQDLAKLLTGNCNISRRNAESHRTKTDKCV